MRLRHTPSPGPVSLALISACLFVGLSGCSRATQPDGPKELSARIASISDTEGEKLSRASLAGLTGIRVAVEPTKGEAREDGLLETEIQAAVEKTLRTRGIQVFNEQQQLSAVGSPYLLITVTASKRDSGVAAGVYSYGIQIALHQEAKLAANGKKVLASTWNNTVIASVGADHFRTQVLENISDLTEVFAKSYLMANPQQGSKP